MAKATVTTGIKFQIMGESMVVTDSKGNAIGHGRAAFYYMATALESLGYTPAHLATGFIRFQPVGVAVDNGRQSLRAVLALGTVQGGETYVKRCTDMQVNGLTGNGCAWRTVDKHNGRRLGYVETGEPISEAKALCEALAMAKVDGDSWAKACEAIASEKPATVDKGKAKGKGKQVDKLSEAIDAIDAK